MLALGLLALAMAAAGKDSLAATYLIDHTSLTDHIQKTFFSHFLSMQSINRCRLGTVALKDCQEAKVARWHLLAYWMQFSSAYLEWHSQPPS